MSKPHNAAERRNSASEFSEQTLPLCRESGQDRRMSEHWSDRWRTRIRTGETAVVIGLWAGGIGTGDLVIAYILLAAGLLIGLIAVLTDPIQSKAARAIACMALIAAFAASGAITYWRHRADEARLVPSPVPSSRPSTPAVPGLTPQQIQSLIRDEFRHQPAPQVVIREEVQIPKDSKPEPPRPDTSFSDVIEKMKRDREKRAQHQACFDGKMLLANNIGKLVQEAYNVQRSYLDSKDDASISKGYVDWKRRADELLSANAAALGDISAFEGAQSKWPPTFLFLHNSGVQAFNNYGTHSEALDKIERAYLANISCPE